MIRRSLLVLGLAASTLASTAIPQTVVPVEQAPYHIPVFGNEHVTVLDVFIPPQRSSGYHRHSLDTLTVLIADAERTGQALGAAETALPSRPRGSVNFALYSREANVHTVTVTGSTPYHNIVIELCKPAPEGRMPASRDGVQGYTQVLDNERARVWRLVLAPGEEAPAITQAAPGIRVVIEGGELIERVPERPDRGMALRSGEFFWQDAGVTRTVRNSGSTRLELVEVELK
jgi:mannose-6-phosphate isomerase-like protein (cupin superfamily)